MTDALGRVVATERKPNTPHEFHFWTAINSPVGIGTIVRVDGAQPMDGQIPHIYGIVVEGSSYTDLQSPMHDGLGHDGLPTLAGFASTERAEIRLGEDLAHQAHAAHDPKVVSIGRRDPRGFLPTVLQRIQSQLRQADRVSLPTHSEDATHKRQTTESEARATSCAEAVRCMMRGIAS